MTGQSDEQEGSWGARCIGSIIVIVVGIIAYNVWMDGIKSKALSDAAIRQERVREYMQEEQKRIQQDLLRQRMRSSPP